MARYLAVAVPVADLRRQPVEAIPLLNIRDDQQESQLLFNEALLFKSETDDWYEVEAIEQSKFDPVAGWHGYTGWVRKKDTAETEKPEGYNGLVKAAFTVIRSSPSQKALPVFPVSIGTRFLVTGEMKSFFEVALPKKRSGWVAKKDVMKVDGGRATAVEVRAQDLVRVARLFLGTPYLWGGRSMQMPWTVGPVMGVDCSGLVNLVFRANNFDVPRDAHEQWMTAKPIALSDLGPGDLIFVSWEDDPASINHVMLSLGAEKFIEATETGDIVRIRTFREKFGCNLGQVQTEAPEINGKHLHFGRMNTGKNG